MTVESAEFIDELVPDNPPQSDLVNEGHLHLQVIKKSAKQSLPESNAPRMLIPKATSGSGNDYNLTIDPGPTTLLDGMVVYFTAHTTNTGKATLTVNALGPKDIRIGPVASQANDIVSGQSYEAVFDGAYWQLIRNGVYNAVTALNYAPMIDKGTVSGAVTIDWNQHDMQKLQMDGNVTLSFTDPSGPSNRLTLLIEPSGGPTGMTLDLPAGTFILNPGFVINQAADGADIIELTYDGQNYYARVFTNYRPS